MSPPIPKRCLPHKPYFKKGIEKRVNPEKSQLDSEIPRINVLQGKVEGIMDIKSGNLGKGDWENMLVLFTSLQTTMEKKV